MLVDTKKEHNLLLKLSDLEWLAFYPKPHFTPEELAVLLENGFKVDFLKEKEEIYAYMLWEDDGTCLSIQSLAIHPSYQRLGYGTTMITALKARLTPKHIGIYAILLDEYLEIGAFLTKNGFGYVSKSETDNEHGQKGIYYNFFYENPNYAGEDISKTE